VATYKGKKLNGMHFGMKERFKDENPNIHISKWVKIIIIMQVSFTMNNLYYMNSTKAKEDHL
jgi:hypothetical protein